MPEAGLATFEITDATGRLLKKRSGFFEKGSKQAAFSAEDFPGSGVYFVRLLIAGQPPVSERVLFFP